MNQSGSIICKNCGNHFEGNYCFICSQSANTHKITWKEIGHFLLHALFHADKGLIYSIKELVIRPGKTIKEYILGKRIYHFNPFLFLILLGGLASVFFIVLDVKLLGENIDFESIEKVNETMAHEHFTIIGGIIIALLTLTDFIFFRNKGFTVPEFFISNVFQVGQLLFFLILLSPFLYLQDYIDATYQLNIEIRTFIIIGFFCYLFFVRYQFYEAKANYWIVFKIILQLIFVYIVMLTGPTKLMIDALR